ncbi:aspartate aminotransferase family protein [Sulfitobacter sp. JBTF-M27]|uniref:Aspartate aminotransferase family protein n=1 Tax=Sulfitobacter sediminilitoris TaxID=2698830 RepID=A0A6P0CHS6_9RHOB|nr:aspartate aminotransferase family protein [Sulfitobacter sediminilitoris]NEK24014.1 aspartate aminotransferase family protein [Sulfitobacter sediminilitoris]
MSHVLRRTLTGDQPVIVKGEGSYLIDSTGKRYLDACGGAAVSSLGHDNVRVREAIAKQMETLSFAHTGLFTNEPAETLADYLIEHAPDGTGEGRVMYLGSGSEAMEAALKLARQYHVERGDTGRRHIIARMPSYHGNTLGALAVSGHAGRRAPFAPLLIDVEHIDAAYAYRFQRDGESEADFALRMANQLEERVQKLGPETVAAFVAEPVVGASLGSQPAPAGYFKRIREICDTHGILYIADEVMCGMGRTGSLFALEQEGIAADITTMAKGLGAGYQPIAAVMASEKVVNAILAGSGKLWNGHTYMSHAVATAGAMAVMREIEDRNLLSEVRRLGDRLSSGLRARLGQHPHVGDIRGRGLFWTAEVVADRDTKEPFDVKLNMAGRILNTGKDAGVICYPSQGCADGTSGDHVLLAPCFTSTDAEIDTIVDVMATTIETETAKAA